MVRARDQPYVWTTWLSRLLAGEAHCEWATWFRAHYQDWVKPPSDFDQTRWMMDHTELVNQARESREAHGDGGSQNSLRSNSGRRAESRGPLEMT